MNRDEWESQLWSEYDAEVRFLLDRLTPEEREAFAGKLLEGVDERVRAAEAVLYDAEAQGRLPEDFRADFERRLLGSAAQRQRLMTARALARHAERSRRRPVRVLWLAMAAGVLLAVAAWGPRLLERREPSVALRAAVLQLGPAQTRSGGTIPEFRIPANGAAEIHIPWDANEPGAVASVEVRKPGGLVAWRGRVPVTAAGKARELVVRVEAPGLQPGLHEIAITSEGGEAIGFLPLRILFAPEE